MVATSTARTRRENAAVAQWGMELWARFGWSFLSEALASLDERRADPCPQRPLFSTSQEICPACCTVAARTRARRGETIDAFHIRRNPGIYATKDPKEHPESLARNCFKLAHLGDAPSPDGILGYVASRYGTVGSLLSGPPDEESRTGVGKRCCYWRSVPAAG